MVADNDEKPRFERDKNGNVAARIERDKNGNVTVYAPVAEAIAEALAPTVTIEERVTELTLLAKDTKKIAGDTQKLAVNTEQIAKDTKWGVIATGVGILITIILSSASILLQLNVI